VASLRRERAAPKSAVTSGNWYERAFRRLARASSMRATAIANSSSPHLSTLSSLGCRKLVAASQIDQARAARSRVVRLLDVNRR